MSTQSSVVFARPRHMLTAQQSPRVPVYQLFSTLVAKSAEMAHVFFGIYLQDQSTIRLCLISTPVNQFSFGSVKVWWAYGAVLLWSIFTRSGQFCLYVL